MLQTLQTIPKAIYTDIHVPDSDIGPGDRLYFKDVPEIRKSLIAGFCTYDSAQVRRSPNGNSVINTSTVASFFVTIVDVNNDQFISDLPLNYFNPLRYQQVVRAFEPFRKINLESSYLTVSESLFLTSATIPFTFFYI